MLTVTTRSRSNGLAARIGACENAASAASMPSAKWRKQDKPPALAGGNPSTRRPCNSMQQPGRCCSSPVHVSSSTGWCTLRWPSSASGDPLKHSLMSTFAPAACAVFTLPVRQVKLHRDAPSTGTRQHNELFGGTETETIRSLHRRNRFIEVPLTGPDSSLNGRFILLRVAVSKFTCTSFQFSIPTLQGDCLETQMQNTPRPSRIHFVGCLEHLGLERVFLTQASFCGATDASPVLSVHRIRPYNTPISDKSP